ncbi:MAG: DUF1232 domain-containing protein [Desulfobulbaceae bacterium]|nr:DUF1232 domain-containing protein [Desulfobulbaceae bacterium]
MDQFFKKISFYFHILFDRDTPWYVKLLLGLGLVYLIYPLDIIPDQIPFLGLMDDLTIGTFLIALAIRLVPSTILDRVQRKIFKS